MSQKIEIDFLIDDVKALLSLRRQQMELEKVRKKLAALNSEGNNQVSVADQIGKKIRDAAATFLGVGSAVAALQTAARIIQGEVAEIRRHQAATGDAQIGYARVMRAALRNVGTDSQTGKANITGPELQVLAENRAAQAGVSPTEYTEALSGALAGVSPSSREDVNKAADIASSVLQIWGDLPLEEMKITAGSIADFMKTNKVNASTAAGALLNLGAMHRTADTLPLSNYALPGAVRTTKVGGTIQEGLGGVGYLSQTMIDPNAEKSGTVWPKFVQEVNDALPEMKSFADRLKFMSQTPAFTKVFFEGGTFDKRKYDKPNLGHGEAIPALKQLVLEPKEMAKYQEYVRNAGDSDKWATVFANNLTELNSTGAIAVAKIKQATTGAIEGMALTQQGLGGVGREQLNAMLAQSGLGQIEQWLSNIQFESHTAFGSVAPIDNVIKQLDERIDNLRRPLVEGVGVTGARTFSRMREAATPEGLDVATKLESVVEHLRKQNEGYETRKALETKLRHESTRPEIVLEEIKQSVKSDPNMTPAKIAKARERVENIKQEVAIKPVEPQVRKAVTQQADDVLRVIDNRGSQVKGKPMPGRPAAAVMPLRVGRPVSATEQQLADNAEAAIRRIAEKERSIQFPSVNATGLQPQQEQIRLAQDSNRQLKELVKLMGQNNKSTNATVSALNKPPQPKPQTLAVVEYKPKVRGAPAMVVAQNGRVGK